MRHVLKALTLHTKYDGCLKKKHLWDGLSFKLNQSLFFTGHHFYSFSDGYLVYIFLKMSEPATSRKNN